MPSWLCEDSGLWQVGVAAGRESAALKASQGHPRAVGGLMGLKRAGSVTTNTRLGSSSAASTLSLLSLNPPPGWVQVGVAAGREGAAQPQLREEVRQVRPITP